MVNQGSHVSIVTFGSKARVNIRPTVVNDFNREGLFGKIPFSLGKDKRGCVSCGLQLASDMAFFGADIILLTASVVNRLPDVTAMSTSRIHAISFGAIEGVWDVVGNKGNVYQVPFDPILTQRSVVDIFAAIVNENRFETSDSKIQKLYQNSIKNPGTAIEGRFVVESAVDGNIWMTLTTEEKEEVQFFEVISPSGRTFEFPKIENGIFYFNFGNNDKVEPGVWNYRVQVQPQGLVDRTVAVEVFGNIVNEGIVVEAWTNRKSVNTTTVAEEPLIIYARVTKNGMTPVENAHVIAKAYAPGIHSEPIEMVLSDDGTGYPDLKSNDGIYSAYFTGYSNLEGGYFIKIEAENKASTVSDGSLVDDFRRIIVAPSFRVVKGLQYVISNGVAEDVDVIPPSRINDLAVVNYVGNGSTFATLMWTSPGDDFRNGKAVKYDIKCLTKPLDDLEFQKNAIRMREELLPRPAGFGTLQTATVEIPWTNDVFYYAIVAVDDAGNVGPVSNLVTLYVEEVNPESTDRDDYYFDGEMDSFSTKVFEAFNNNDTVVYIVSGGIAGFLLMVTIIVIISVCRTRRSAKELRQRQSLERTRVYVNEIDNRNEEPVVNYSDVWMTNGSQGQLVVPEVETCQVMYPRPAEAPTYQNWNAHLPSEEDGMTTTSSTAHSTSSESDACDKKALFGTWNASNPDGKVNLIRQNIRHYSESFHEQQDQRVHNSSDFMRKKRQESLV